MKDSVISQLGLAARMEVHENLMRSMEAWVDELGLGDWWRADRQWRQDRAVMAIRSHYAVGVITPDAFRISVL